MTNCALAKYIYLPDFMNGLNSKHIQSTSRNFSSILIKLGTLKGLGPTMNANERRTLKNRYTNNSYVVWCVVCGTFNLLLLVTYNAV